MVTSPDEQKTFIKQTIDATHNFLYTAGTLYEFMPTGIYKKVEDQQVASYLTSMALKNTASENAGADLFSNHDIEEFTNYIKRKYFMRWEEVQSKQDRNLIPFTNMVFNIRDFKRMDETLGIDGVINHYFFFQIPHALNEEMLNASTAANYTPEQALQNFAPHIYAFFKDIVGEDKIVLQLAKIGYTFYPSNPFKLMFMEIGAKDAGKTTFLKLFSYVIGERNISTISLQDLADYRFARAELWGKLANIYDDLPATQIKNLGILKMLSGESRIDAPVKFKQEIQSFVNTAKSVYTTNRLPFIKDNADEAFFSRWVITNYPNHFPRNDKFFSNLVSDEKEIEGLIVASLLALRDLLARKLSFEDKTSENMDLWQRQNNNVYAFVSDKVKEGTYILNADLKIEKDLIYSAYSDYCNEMEIDAYTKTRFTQELQRLFSITTTLIQKENKRIPAYKGVGTPEQAQTQLPKHEPPQLVYTGSEGNVVCPQCGKATALLYKYDGKMGCLDCLNKALAEKGEPTVALDVSLLHKTMPNAADPQPSITSHASQQSDAKTQANAPESKMPTIDAKQAVERVYIAIKYNVGKEFWKDEQLGEPNAAFYPYLQGMNTDIITQALSALQTQGSIYKPKPNIWKAVSDPRTADKLSYSSAIACPQCSKPTSQLYSYDDDWMCVDCLNARQHQGEDYEV
jgi:P4 family phage/plasmid primase-like protien